VVTSQWFGCDWCEGLGWKALACYVSDVILVSKANWSNGLGSPVLFQNEVSFMLVTVNEQLLVWN
jgi:hypothetical protein